MAAGQKCVILFNPRSVRRLGAYTLPMGLIMTAAHVNLTHKVVLIDQAVERDWRRLLETALANRPICMGISAMTGRQIQEGLAAARMAREHGCKTVWGGLHPSLIPQQTLEHPLVDFVVEGEGEQTFPEVVRALETGGSVATIPGLWSKEGAEPHYGGKRPFVQLDELPPIPYELVELNRYLRPAGSGMTMSIYSSRGCPQRCRFCYNRAVHDSHWRSFSAERVLEDIRRIRTKAPALCHMEFWDDSFFPDMSRARGIAAGIAQFEPAITWSVLGAHVRDIKRMDDAYLRFLRASGMTDIVIGAESGSQGVIDSVRKNFQVDELLDANRRLAQHDIRPSYTFISGIPGETDEDIRSTVKLMFRLKAEHPKAILGNIKPFVPYPGTELYEFAVANGFNPPRRLEDWSRFVWGNYVNLPVPWVSQNRRKMLNNLYFYTVALSPEYLFINSRLFTFLARLILPVVRWRVRHLWFRFPLAARVMALAERFLL